MINVTFLEKQNTALFMEKNGSLAELFSSDRYECRIYITTQNSFGGLYFHPLSMHCAKTTYFNLKN